MSYDKVHKLHIVTAVAVVRNEKGKYLVLKRAEHEAAYLGMYTLSGGKLLFALDKSFRLYSDKVQLKKIGGP